MRDDGASRALAVSDRPTPIVDLSEASRATASDAGAATVRSPSFRPGAVIAEKYVVERLIGEGGLGVVVAARHLQLEQMVAIKYLRPKALANPTLAERFVREARLAAKIRSDHVARVYDVGTLPSGAPYMVMEYLSGMDLGRVLGATGPLPVWRAVEYVLQACVALGEAHAAGIVHRDIKPENLFVTTGPTGAPLLKVLDFGISKIASARVEPGQGGALTQTGEMFGTPVYMSPEQLVASDDVDVRTDVWAIGVVLYQLLAARLPFEGESLPELCTAIISKSPASIEQVRSDLPPGLRRAIEKCLAKAAEDRFQTVADLGRELAPFAGATREQRLEQALRTMDGADKGRPVTPLPDELLTRALRAAPVPSFPEERWSGGVATTGSGVASWTPPALAAAPKRAKRSKFRLLGLVAAGAAGGALAVLAAMGSGAGDKASGAPAPVAAPALQPDPVPSSPLDRGPATPVAAELPPVVPPASPASEASVESAVPGPAPSAQSPGVPAGRTRPPRAPKASAGSPSPAHDAAGAQATPAAPPATGAATASPRPRPVDPNAILNPFE